MLINRLLLLCGFSLPTAKAGKVLFCDKRGTKWLLNIKIPIIKITGIYKTELI